MDPKPLRKLLLLLLVTFRLALLLAFVSQKSSSSSAFGGKQVLAGSEFWRETGGIKGRRKEKEK